MEKTELRKLIRQRKQQYTVAELEAMSATVVGKILSHHRVVDAQTVMLYYALPDEVDTHQLIDELVKLGKTVLLPKIIGDGQLEVRVYTGRHDLVQELSFHIMEPVGELYQTYDDIEVALVPGMGFDDEGNRLGRGKGYYDHLLAAMPHTYKIGVCFDFQKVTHVPTAEWDIKMDEVIA